jgi:hypothetical protein
MPRSAFVAMTEPASTSAAPNYILAADMAYST